MVIALCMHGASYSIIGKFQTWIGRSNWPALIRKVEHDYLGIFKVHDIRDKASRTTAITVASMLNAKKREWFESGDGQQR